MFHDAHDKDEILVPKISPLGRTAKQVAHAVVGLPWKVDNEIIGEVSQAWQDGFDVVIRVKFYRKFANEIKSLNMPQSEQELPEERVYRLEVRAWDKVFDQSLRVKLMRG